MIISISRRTDIPACYSDWLYNRIREGYVLTRNPMRFHQVSRVSLLPEAVDGIVFWTKNPAPMMERLEELREYTYYFQFTLTAYGKDMEPGVPSKNSEIIPTFQRLAQKIGPERIIWRYDPILLSEKYTADYHVAYFSEIAKRLKGCTKKCVISFLDQYRGASGRLSDSGLMDISDDTKRCLAEQMAKTARLCGMDMDTCAEEIDLGVYGIGHAKCVDSSYLLKLGGHAIKAAKDKNQRPACGCDASVDIGMYNTCTNGCRYCYASHAGAKILFNSSRHDPFSPLLIGRIEDGDEIRERA